MAKPTATKGSNASAKNSTNAAKKGKKRARDTTDVKIAESSSNSGGDGSSSSDSDSDSDDDETEKTLFKPTASEVNDKEEESSSSEDEQKPTEEEESSSEDEDEGGTDANADNVEEEEAKAKTEATVYVEGISYDADESDLVTHFSQCGTVKEVRFPRYQDSGKPRGYAHISFDSPKSVEKALQLDGKYLLKRYLTIRKAQTPRVVEQSQRARANLGQKNTRNIRTVFIKQLPYDIEEQDIQKALEPCGSIVSVRLPMWNHTKKLKGFGYVEFADEKSARNAVKKSGMRIGDRMVLIDLDTAGAGPKQSFRKQDGTYWHKGEEAKKSLAKKLASKEPSKKKRKQE